MRIHISLFMDVVHILANIILWWHFQIYKIEILYLREIINIPYLDSIINIVYFFLICLVSIHPSIHQCTFC